MRKYLLTAFALLAVFLAIGQSGDGMVVIKGVLSGDLKGYHKVYRYTRTTNDSAVVCDGQYTFSFPFTQPSLQMLYPEYVKSTRQAYQPFGILVSRPGVYYVVSDISAGMQLSEVNGPEDMLLYRSFEKEQSKAGKSVQAFLADKYGEKWWQVPEKDPRHAAIQQSADSLRNVLLVPLIDRLVQQHPDAYASAFVLVASGRQIGSLEKKERWYGQLSERIKASAEGKSFGDYIQGLKSSAAGSTVAGFVLPDPQGKDVDFAALRGKYVLIDFWASWCVPCRKSFPHMRAVYQKYKSDRFEIYSISTDENRDAWLKALQQEGNPWLQAHDTKNIAQKNFAVTGLPTTFLIDPQGKILLKEVGFNPDGTGVIEKKLRELLGDGE